MKNKPFSVVLFDDIEKAHPEVSNILLQILDYGRLTDASGVTTNFRETIIILTSNVHPSEIKLFFRPELLGRLKVVPFRQLAEKDMREIAKKKLDDLSSMLIDEKQVELLYCDDVLSYLASGLCGNYGVRELKRAIEAEIIHPLSYLMLQENIEKVTVGVEEGEIKLN